MILQVSEQEKNQTAHRPASSPSQTSSRRNEQSNIYYTKNKKIIFWLYLLLTVAFIVSQATLVSYNWKQYQTFAQSDSYFFANQVASQWKKGFVIDIKVTNAVDCPTNYQNAFNFKWPGTSFGCFCQVNVNSSFVLEGYCSPKLIQTSCRNIQSQEDFIASLWRNSSKLCIKRSPVSFQNEKKYDGSNKICGSSKSLTIVPNNQACPLVNATFYVPEYQDHYSLLSDTNSMLDPFYGTFNSTSPYSFYSYPISKFSVSEFQFCLIDEDSGISPDRIQFILLNLKRGCAQTGKYQFLDSMTQLEFYQNNPQLNNLSSLSGFPKPGNQIYNLGFANLPSWTYNCRHNYDKKFSIPKALLIINFQFYTTYYYIALVQILMYSIEGFQVFILAIRRLLKKEVYPVGYRQKYLPRDFCFALARYIIDTVCKLTALGFIIYTSYTIFVNWNWFKSSLNLNCPDAHQILIENVMEPYRDMYQKSLIYAVSQLVVFLFVAIIDLIHFIYIYRNDLQHYLVESYGKVMVEHTVKDDLDWIQKDADKKLLNIQSLDKSQDVNDGASEKFRVTMAMNIFDNEKLNEEPVKAGKVVKKKKKKFGAFKKDFENADIKNSDDLVTFGFEGNSLIGLNSIDNISGDRNKEETVEEDKSKDKKFERARRRKK